MTEELSIDLPDPIEQLTAVLRAENAALEAMDLVAAGAMLADKQAALGRFAAAEHKPSGPFAARLLAELQELTEKNRRLLERGMVVQNRLIEMVAHAAKEQSASELAAYGSRGAPRPPRMPAIALASRA